MHTKISTAYRPIAAVCEIDELAQRLRALPETTGSVLVTVTGYGQESDRKRALAAGFNYHLVKPVDTTKLPLILAQINETLAISG